MEPKLFCQSCTMPIDNMEDRGTEKDGSASDLYCKYCYKDGAFTDPKMTLEQMKNMAVAAMQQQKLPNDIIQRSLNMLPTLKRWKENVTESRL
jgi:hypothetical protein